MEKKTLFSEKSINIGPDSGYDNYIMAIESSCDETACAIVKTDVKLLQILLHLKLKHTKNSAE